MQWRGWSVVIVLAAAGAAAQAFGWLEPFDRAVSDEAMRFNRDHRPRAVAHEPVIVGIDEAFLDGVEEPLTLNHLYLSRFLQAMARAQPKVVGIDMVLPEKRFETLALKGQPAFDFHRTLLAALLTTSRQVNIVAAKVWDPQRDRFREIQVDYATVLAMQPRGRTAHASVEFCQDADKRVRRYPDCLPVDTTFSGEIAAAMGATGPWSGRIDYQAGAPFTYLPLKQVLDIAARGDDATLQRLFRGRAVLLGTVLDDVDLIAAPVRMAAWRPGDDRVPGVVVHAQIVRNMLGRGLVQPVPQALLVLLAAASALFWFGARMVPKFALFGLFTVLLLGASVQLLEHGWWLAPGAALATALAACAARGALEGWRGWRERKRLADTFSGYVSPAVMSEILKAGASHQQGRKLTVCVLFSDIRNFTTLSEHMPAEDVVQLLNRYFARMTAIVHRHGGTVDKFIGDGLMAFFGAPNALASPSQNAFNAARDMLDELAVLNGEFEAEGRAPIAIGVGLHLGEAVIGSIGSAERHAYTAIGDSVNTASRLEGLCKELGYPVVCSETVAQVIGEAATLVPLGSQKIKGRSAVTVYGWRPPTHNVPQPVPGLVAAAAP